LKSRREKLKPRSHTSQPLADFRANPDKALARLRRSGKPVLLTKNGKPQAMLIDVRKLSLDATSHELERMIEEAEADFAAGRIDDYDKFIMRFRREHNL